MKFKSDIEVQAGLKDSSGAAGTSGQVLSSDGTAVSWIDAEIGVARDVQNRVKAGVAINKGQAVYVTGAGGTNIIVGLASNTSEATSSKTLGLLNSTVATNGFADVVQIGKLTGLNTIGAVVGDPVWLGTNGNLIYGLTNKPYAPAHLVYIGVVTRVNASNGEIFVTVQNGFELNEIHDVDIKTTTPTNGDILGYNGSLWVNKTIPGWLGYTPANDANVVHLTGTETITGAKTFTTAITIDKATANTDALLLKVGGNQQGRITINNDGGFDLFTSTDNSGYGINFDANDSNGILFYADNPSMPKFIVGDNYNRSQQDLYSPKFIKDGGNSTQYLKADGSVSTAMNSRIEVNFIATSGQTTFVTPYEVGQVDVYYNGSKLYPNEFTATNGTDIILATGATLNAQISIVKYVSTFSTTAIRNEATFTATAGQTTFAVNYSPGQVDVFYNGSKLNISEFTATNGTSVVLGFACAAGESIVIDSYVNQISGASGTTNYVSKFTGAASLGDSQIIDNGISVGIATAILSEKLNLDGNMLLRSAGAIKFNRTDNAVSTNLYDASSYFVLDNRNANGFAFQATGANVVNITAAGLLGIGTGLTGSARLNILNVASAPFLALRSTNNVYEIAKMSFDQNTDILSIVNNQGASSSGITFGTNNTERVRITSGGFTKISNSASYYNIAGNYHEFSSNIANNDSLILQNLSGSPYGMWYRFTSSPNNTTNYFIAGSDSSEAKFYIYSNGTMLNKTGVYGAISDIKYKENVVDATSKLEDISKLKVRNFNFIGDETKQIGFIAQEFEEVFPGMVDISTKKVEDGEDTETYKSIKTSVLTPILVKAMQELAEQVRELKAEIEILKNK